MDFDRENQIIAFEIFDAKKLAGLSRIKVAMSPLLVETHKWQSRGVWTVQRIQPGAIPETLQIVSLPACR